MRIGCVDGRQLNRLKASYLLPRHADLVALFNQFEVRLGHSADKADGHTTLASAACAADAVGVVNGRAGQVVIHHRRKLGNVDAARCHVGCHHHLHAFSLEVHQNLRAFALAELAMEGFGLDVGLAQLVGHDFGSVFGGYKHQHAAPFFGLDHMAQQLGAA